MRAAHVVVALTALLPVACGKIAGFEDLTTGCPGGDARCERLLGSGGTGGKATSTGGTESGGSPDTGGDTSDGGNSSDGGAPEGSGGTGTGGLAGSGGEGGGTGGAPAVCSEKAPGREGPAMSRFERNGAPFWIDQTEVTVDQYAKFVAAHFTFDEPLCQAAPTGGSFPCESEPEPADGTLPKTCVDWCDAAAYCAWAGKELCVDDSSPPPASARDDLLAASDFFVACSASADVIYGCGAGCSAIDCNGQALDRGKVLPVGAASQCCVADRCSPCAVKDLSGNAAEWTAACSPATEDGNCVVRGGNYDSPAQQLECGAFTLLKRRTKYTTVGFRCCAH